MADKKVDIQPGSFLTAATTVVAQLEHSATPPPAAATPIPRPGSPVDVAAGGVAASMQAKMAAMSAALAPRGPALAAAAGAGVAGLEASDAAGSNQLASIPEAIGKAVSGGMSAGGSAGSALASIGAGFAEGAMSSATAAVKPMANVTTTTPLKPTPPAPPSSPPQTGGTLAHPVQSPTDAQPERPQPPKEPPRQALPLTPLQPQPQPLQQPPPSYQQPPGASSGVGGGNGSGGGGSGLAPAVLPGFGSGNGSAPMADSSRPARSAPRVSPNPPAAKPMDWSTDRVPAAPPPLDPPPGDPPPPAPVIHPPTQPPAPAPNPHHDDLDDTIPNTDHNIGGDPKGPPPPQLDGKPNPLYHPGDGKRPIPTGTLDGADGHKFGFFSQPPYNVPGQDGKPIPNKSYVTPNSAIVDLNDPSKIIGNAPVAQASGAYNSADNSYYIVGNNADGVREMWKSQPVDPANPNAWAAPGAQWQRIGDVLPGDRESQITALQGGGFLLTGADNAGNIAGATASTPQGLIGNFGTPLMAPADPNGLFGAYGPTIVSDHFDPATGLDTIQMRLSQFGDPALFSPDPNVEWPYDPRLFNTTFTVAQPPPIPAPPPPGQ